MATYLSRVRALTDSSTTQTSNAQVVDFLKSSVNYVLMSVPKQLLWFAYTNASFTSSTGVSIPQNTIISVRRGSYECDELPKEYTYAASTTLTSFYKGSALFPKYYLRAGIVYTNPASTTGAAGAVTYVNISATLMTTAVTSSGITLSPLEGPLIYHAAGLDFTALAGHWSQLAGDAGDALTKAKVLIDSATDLTQGEDAEDHLYEEDPELVNASVQIASQELNRATVNMNYYTGKSQLCQGKATEMFKLADNQIKMYIQSNGGKA